MSETLTPSGQFWVRTIRAQARRAAKAHGRWSYEMGRWMEIRGRRKPGTEGWTYCDNVCRPRLGARGGLRRPAGRAMPCRAARVCPAKSHLSGGSCA
jgi:hypothetical protein